MHAVFMHSLSQTLAAWLVADDAAPPDQQSFLMQMGPILLMFVAVYFLMLRPMWKQNKKQQDMLKALKKDDEVATTGGMYGRIHAIDERVVTLEISNGVRIKVLRSAIQGAWPDEAKQAAQAAAAAKGKG